MQNFNYHTHTYRCGHADKYLTDEDYVKLFIEKGFKEIAFTDHCPQKNKIDFRKSMRMDYSQKDEYIASINKLKEKYKDKINIKVGFEVEYDITQEENLLELKKETDILILGQHFIVDNNQLKIFFKNDYFSDDDLLNYANTIAKALEKNLVEIIAHPDSYMYVRNNFGDIEEKVAHIICKYASKYNIPLEINLTEVNRYLIGILDKISYPCKEFWDIASKYNVKVLYGIDAHYKNQIENYEKSIELANKIIGKDTISKLNFIDKL